MKIRRDQNKKNDAFIITQASLQYTVIHFGARGARQVAKPQGQVQHGSHCHRNIARQLPLTPAYLECNHRTGIDRTKSALIKVFHIKLGVSSSKKSGDK